MAENRQPILVTQGSVFLDGVKVMDSVSFTLKFTPKIWEGTQLGDFTSSSRWVNGKITGTLVERRSTAWLKNAVRKYLDSGATPEFTLQGVSSDRNSDYFRAYGTHTVTAVGCVLTGDINLLELDTNGDVVQDSIAFNAHNMV